MIRRPTSYPVPNEITSMQHDLTFLRPLVVRVLCEPFAQAKWTVQGFGFLRTYFGPRDNPKRFRLNLWDSRFAVPNVSTIHDHPWDFKSLIVAGQFCNVRYDIADVRSGPRPMIGPTHDFSTITTGINSTLERSPTEFCKLTARKPELYAPGEVYSQAANEVHETFYKDGSVTLNERVGDTEKARVFWPAGTDWVDALPRVAERDEVISATGWALGAWFDGYR